MTMLPILADAALKGTVVLLLALLLAWDRRRAAASRLHFLWALTLAGLLILPLLSWLLPSWTFVDAAASEPPAPATMAADLEAEVQVTASTALLDGTATPADPEARRNRAVESGHTFFSPPPLPQPPAHVPARHAWDVSAWLCGTWLTGVGMSLGWIGLGFVSLGLLTRRCQQIDGELNDLCRSLATQLGIRRSVRLWSSSDRKIPMTWGVFRPVVLLPDEARSWPNERQRVVLLHELAHVQRWDCLAQLLGQLARALYWFQPLAWWALWRLRAEQENACDDVVLQSGVPAPSYSEHLLALTARLPARLLASPLALGMARARQLRRRVQHLLDSGCDRRPLRGAVALAGMAAMLIVVGVTASITFEPARANADDKAAPQAQAPAGQDELLKRIAEIQEKLKENYVVPLDRQQLIDAAVRGLLEGLKDPYTDYLPARDLKMVSSQLKGAMTGIGAQLKVADERVTVLSPLENSPALKAGLRPGDVIEEINGASARGLTIQQAVQRILGPAGTPVKLKIIRPDGVVKEISITRDALRIPSLGGFRRDKAGHWVYILDPQYKLAYIQVHQFSKNTAHDLADIIRGLERDGLKGLILDFRFCPGGLLDEAVAVGKLFLADGVIVTTRRPGKEEQVFKADGKDTLSDFPLVVLVNEHTASSAEIVAGALRDRGRAVLVGTRTFGKGSVQAIVKLDNGGALRVTTAFHYLPSGRNIQKRPGSKDWGIEPTEGFYVPLTRAQNEALIKSAQQRGLLGLNREEQPPVPARITPALLAERYADPQLAAALRTLVARVTGGEFVKTGKSLDLLHEHVQRVNELSERRAELLRNLQKLEEQIEEVQGTKKQ